MDRALEHAPTKAVVVPCTPEIGLVNSGVHGRRRDSRHDIFWNFLSLSDCCPPQQNQSDDQRPGSLFVERRNRCPYSLQLIGPWLSRHIIDYIFDRQFCDRWQFAESVEPLQTFDFISTPPVKMNKNSLLNQN